MKDKCYTTFFKVGAVTVFGFSKIFSSTGQAVFATQEGLKYIEIESVIVRIGVTCSFAISTAYIRGFTRIPALWKQFTTSGDIIDVTLVLINQEPTIEFLQSIPINTRALIIHEQSYWQFDKDTNDAPVLTRILLNQEQLDYLSPYLREEGVSLDAVVQHVIKIEEQNFRGVFSRGKQNVCQNYLADKGRHEIAAIMIALVISVTAGLSDTLQSYLGSDVLTDIILPEGEPGVKHNHYGERTFNAFVALSSMVAYFAFVTMKSLRNATDALHFIQNEDFCLIAQQAKWRLFKTIIVTSFGVIAFSAYSFFLSKNAVTKIVPEVSNEAAVSIAIIASIATFITMLLSRVAETYKYFGSTDRIKLDEVRGLNLILIVPAMLLGITDILAFIFGKYTGFVNLLEIIGLRNKAVTSSLAILPALSSGLMHYVFSVRPVLKTNADLGEKWFHQSEDNGQIEMQSLLSSEEGADISPPQPTVLAHDSDSLNYYKSPQLQNAEVADETELLITTKSAFELDMGP